MAIDGLQNTIKSHPVRVSLTLALCGSVFALRPLPPFLTLTALLALIRIVTQLAVRRPEAKRRVIGLWSCITIGSLISFAIVGKIGLESPLPILFYAAVFSSLALLPYLFAGLFGTNVFTTPAIWCTWTWLVTKVSPIGRLGIWSPLSGEDSYSWLRPLTGEMGMDWVIAGWVEVCSAFVLWHLFDRYYLEDGDRVSLETAPLLVDDDGPLMPQPNNSQAPAPRPQTTKLSTWSQVSILAFILLGLTVPSAFITTLPLPVHDDGVKSIGVACALPPANTSDAPFNAYLKETMAIAGRAQIVLWPEGAVAFDSISEYKAKMDMLSHNASSNGIYIGVSFTVPAGRDKDTSHGKLRNGFALINRDGILLEYYKRNLVPLVEGFPQVAGTEPPSVVNITMGSKQRHSQQWNMTVAASICLDFAHPLPNLPTKPSLILGPARTWQIDVGMLMMEMASHRAQELGTTVFWCDGGKHGLSGLVGNGHSGVQVGSGTRVETFSLRVPLEEQKTWYGSWGSFWPLCFAWFLAAWMRAHKGRPAIPHFVHNYIQTTTIGRIKNFVFGRRDERPLIDVS